MAVVSSIPKPKENLTPCALTKEKAWRAIIGDITCIRAVLLVAARTFSILTTNKQTTGKCG